MDSVNFFGEAFEGRLDVAQTLGSTGLTMLSLAI